jgi:hypothetical protein
VARIEWVKQKLENWALWKERENAGGLGFARQSVLLSGSVIGGYREAIVPVDDVEASVTNEAVESLRLSRAQLYVTLYHVYIDDVGIREAARLECLAESSVKAHLDQADHALSGWFGDRAARKK